MSLQADGTINNLGRSGSLRINSPRTTRYTYWNNPSNDFWNIDNNWSYLQPINDTTSDIAAFNGQGATTSKVSTPTRVYGLLIGSNSSNSMTLSGSQLTIGSYGLSAYNGNNTVGAIILNVPLSTAGPVIIDGKTGNAAFYSNNSPATRFDASNSFTKGVIVKGGSMLLNNPSNPLGLNNTLTISGGDIGATQAVTIDASVSSIWAADFFYGNSSTNYSTRFNGPVTITGSRTVTFSGPNNNNFTVPAIFGGGGTYDLNIVNGTVGSYGTQAFIMNDPNGTTSTYTGNTTISGINSGTIGILQTASTNVLPYGAGVGDVYIYNNGQLQPNSPTNVNKVISTVNGSLNGSNTLYVASNNDTFTYLGQILNGNLSVYSGSTGVVTLSGDVTTGGNILAPSGIINLNYPVTGSSSIFNATGGTININSDTAGAPTFTATTNGVINSIVGNTGGANYNAASGTVNLSGTYTGAGTLTIGTGGTLNVYGDLSGCTKTGSYGAGVLNWYTNTCLPTTTQTINGVLSCFNLTGSALTTTTSPLINCGNNPTFFGNSDTANNDITLGGNMNFGASRTITLNGGAILTVNGIATNTQAGNTTITLNDGVGATTRTALNFNGGLAISNSATTRTLTIAGSLNTVIGGAIIDGGTATGCTMAYTGAGQTILISGNNTYSGPTTIGASGTGQVFNLNTTTPFGATGGAVTTSTSVPTLDNVTGSPLTLNNNYQYALGVGLAYSTSSGTANNDLNLGNGGLSVNASRAITLNGAGILTIPTLTNAQAGNPTITVSNGTGTTARTLLVVNGGVILSNSGTARTVTFAGGGNSTIVGSISSGSAGGTASALSYTGTGTLTLSGLGGDANGYTGATTVNNAAGTLVLGLAAAYTATGTLVLTTGTINFNSQYVPLGTITLTAGTIDNTSASAVTIATNNTITWGGSIAYGGTGDLTFGTGSVNSGAAARTMSTTGTRTLTFGGKIVNTFAGDPTYTFTRTSGSATLRFAGLNMNNTSATTPRNITVTGSQPVIFTGTCVSGSSTGLPSTLTYTGTSTLTLAGANTYTGLTTVNSSTGTVILNTNCSLAGAANITVGTLQGPTATGATATITGNVTLVNNASATICAGTFGDNVLSTGALSFQGSNTHLAVYSTGTSGVAGKIVATGNVVLSACRVDLYNTMVGSGTTYTLISCTGTMKGGAPTVNTNLSTRTAALSVSSNLLVLTLT